MLKLNIGKLEALTQLLQREIPSKIPGAVISIGIDKEVIYKKTIGFAENKNGITRLMQEDTLFDLASLTKVTATLPSVLSLIDDGKILLTDPVSKFIPEFAEGNKSAVTVRHLLTHTSGLPPFRLYYKDYSIKEDILRAVRRESLENDPGSAVVYSDLGFILLGQIVEEVTEKSLDIYAKERIFDPLRMTNTCFCPSEDKKLSCAATEEMFGNPPKVGVVHDENAQALQGISGHAGLFAPMSDLIKYVQFWVDMKQDVLSPAIKRISTSLQTSKLEGNRGLGWVCRHDVYDHVGDLWPETTVGHTGFTGTSLAFDIDSRLWMVVLTNDVHYGREHKTIVRLRRVMHNLVGAALMF